MNTTARTGLVTGSNRGIGAGIALRLAADGADVAINYLEGEAEAEAIAARIRALGRRALLVPADLRDPQALTAMMDQVLQTFGGLDILVNNAGIGI
ncbi:MAG: oxidoreductase, partial [Chthonomonadaceae bacterium]|nr:oxidoreductase [Chthonomonadaceae bacterium]